GWGSALAINAGTYPVSVVALLVIRHRPAGHGGVAPRLTVRHYLAEVGDGWRIVRHNAVVGLALVAAGAVWIGGGFLHVAGNQHIQRAASAPGMERVGVLMCALGVGSGLSAWWLNHRGASLPRHLVLGLGLILAGGGMVAFAVSTRFAVFSIAAFV